MQRAIDGSFSLIGSDQRGVEFLQNGFNSKRVLAQDYGLEAFQLLRKHVEGRAHMRDRRRVAIADMSAVGPDGDNKTARGRHGCKGELPVLVLQWHLARLDCDVLNDHSYLLPRATNPYPTRNFSMTAWSISKPNPGPSGTVRLPLWEITASPSGLASRSQKRCSHQTSFGIAAMT